VYPADRMPPPYPVAFPVNREEGIARYRALLSPAQHRGAHGRGDTEAWCPGSRCRRASRRCSRCGWCGARTWPKDVARYEFVA
jgi:hypothetical protein